MSSKTIALCASILLLIIILERLRYLPNNVVINMYFRSEFRGRELVKRKLFADYLKRFNKSYGPNETRKRFHYFKETLKDIERLNDGRNNAIFGVTKFSDLSKQEKNQMLSPNLGLSHCDPRAKRCSRPSEFTRRKQIIEETVTKFSDLSKQEKNQMLSPNLGLSHCDPRAKRCSRPSEFTRRKQIIEEERDRMRVRDHGKIPQRMDWREIGVVGPIIDQRLCEICWAASIAGVMESMAAIHEHNFKSLSVQQLIDCAYFDQSDKMGCGRGRPPIDVFRVLCEEHIQLVKDEDYPLTLAEERCKNVHGRISLKSFDNICDMYKNESKLVEAVSRGPVVVLVCANLFFNYDSGVISWHCQVPEDTLNHAVQIVGYDTTSDPPYFIIKNSWGDDWGEEGYARLAIGGNQCGIAYSVGVLDVYTN